MTPGLMTHPIGWVVGEGSETVQLSPTGLWGAWNWEPAVLLMLVGSAVLYGYGVRRLWVSAGMGRGLPFWQPAAFASGWLVLVVALISPLDALSALLFSAHMVQHELLMVIAAPLLVLGRPQVAWLWGMRRAWGRGLGRWWREVKGVRSLWHGLSTPLVAWSLHATVLWGWHAPALYQAAIERAWVHALQHLSFFGSALLFWWALLYNRHGRLGYGVGVLAVFTTAVHSSVLGALITASPAPWYRSYLPTTGAWNLTPLEDQQLAGLIMWVPTGVIYLVAGLALFVAWLGETERRVVQREAWGLATGRERWRSKA
ncbi:MAG TPA: cytochrome c oxidase assembly protein [Alphaproteobacteria bacterium]|nr:cytochrome c oxidase assembly protein [Alphaproteobacteria bacterium]